MKKEFMQNVCKAGNIEFELKEIKKTQKSVDSYLSLWSNTCSGLLTLICC